MSAKSVLVLQHIACEGPGLAGSVLQDKGYQLEIIRGDQGQPVPKELGPWSGILVLGGPMNADELERYPFLDAERNLLQLALHEERPVMGLCLGAQLLARVLGAPVSKARRPEVGFHRIFLTEGAQSDPLLAGFPQEAWVFQWHGDTFDLPLGATHLARSPICENQAFRWGASAWALQFHLEVSMPMAFEWIEAYQREIARDPNLDATEIKAHARQSERFAQLAALARPVFEAWADLLE